MSADAAANTVNNINPADLTGEVLTTYVEALAESGIKPVSIASYVHGLNCFLVWLERKGHIPQSLDAMVLRVLGKGQRERLIPFSPELRKVLFRWIESEKGKSRMVQRSGVIVRDPRRAGSAL